LTAKPTADAKYYSFGVGCMRLTEISHLLNELGIVTVPHIFCNSQSHIPSITNILSRRTAVAHSSTKYYLDDDMARDGEINKNYIPTAGMLADCFR
jgi:hypothetical protein